MNVTDRTLEDVLIDLVEKGEVVRLVVVGVVALILGLLAGWFFTNIYFSKFKYIQLKNKVDEAEHKKKDLEKDVAQLKSSYAELEKKYAELEHLHDKRHAVLATVPDEIDPSLKKVFKE